MKVNMLELEYANHAAEFMVEFADVELLYVTAEFSPFSNQFKPDLAFSSLGDDESQYFIEIRFGGSTHVRTNLIEQLPIHKEFAQESLGRPIRFAFASDFDIDSKKKSFLADNQIVWFSLAKEPENFAHDLLTWAGILPVTD